MLLNFYNLLTLFDGGVMLAPRKMFCIFNFVNVNILPLFFLA